MKTAVYSFILVLFTFALSSCAGHRHRHHYDGKSCTSCQKSEMGGQCKAHMQKCEKCAEGKCECGKNCKCPECADALKKTSSLTEDPHSPIVKTGKLADVPYHFRSNTYFAGALTAKAVEAAQKENVATIINLQTPDDLKWDEKTAVEAKGMKYYHFPLDGKGASLNKNTLAEIEKVFMQHHKNGEKVLIHCTKGNVTASWFAYHLKTAHKVTTQEAVTDAKKVGLFKEDLILNTLNK